MLVCGVGVNDAEYITQPKINGKQVCCPFYRVWHDMLTRCYSKKHQLKRPTYINCIVCEKWLTFSNFKTWMENQDWEGKHLDKDLLGDGKLYSPETCCFVEGWLNNLFTNCNSSGVCYVETKGKFKAQLSIKGRRKHLGYFDRRDKAIQKYSEAKCEYVTQLMVNYPNQRIKKAVLSKI